MDNRDNDGQTALQGEAAMNRCKDKSVVNLVDESGNTVLHLAAHFGSSTIVSGLLKNGANAGALNKDKQTPLHWAAKKGHEAAVEILLNQEGIDLNAVDKDDLTALHWAARNGHEAVVQELVQHDDIRIDAKTKYQHTPLHLAAKEGHSSVVAVLLQSGANINAQNDDLMTPLHWAAAFGHKTVVQELLQHRDTININPRDKWGNTPLSDAKNQNHTEIVLLLKEHGATE